MSVHILQEPVQADRPLLPKCARQRGARASTPLPPGSPVADQRRASEEGRLLRDIGVTREQALREADKLFWRP